MGKVDPLLWENALFTGIGFLPPETIKVTDAMEKTESIYQVVTLGKLFLYIFHYPGIVFRCRLYCCWFHDPADCPVLLQIF